MREKTDQMFSEAVWVRLPVLWALLALASTGLLPGLLTADTRSVPGRVTDLRMQPLEGVRVRPAAGGAQTVTDSEGRFALELPVEYIPDRGKNDPDELRAVPLRATLHFTKSGFKPRRVPVYEVSESVEVTLYGIEETIPVIYSTDLYHPHHDPDDHFDLATIYALDELDIKHIILDNARGGQDDNPGTVPVRQMNHITGRSIPTATGLGRPLRSPGDKALDQPERWQQGVRRIIEILRESPKKVTIITVGSVRDVAAAYNREPDLLRRKVDRLLMFIGNATTDPPPPDQMFRGMEYNVSLDPLAYVRIMRSDLPVYWAPCFGQDGYTTIWRARRRDLLAQASGPVKNFFFYMWDKNRTDDPVAYLSRHVERPVPKGDRWMWCCAVFAWVGGRQFVRVADQDSTECRAVSYRRADGRDELAPFGFKAIEVTTEVRKHPDGAIVRTRFRGETADSNRVMVFKKKMPSRKVGSTYASIVTSASARLIGELGRTDPQR